MRPGGILLAGVLAAFAPGAAAVAPPPWLELQPRAGAESELASRLDPLAAQRREALVAEGHPYVDRVRRHEIAIGPGGRLEERIVLVRHLLNDAGVRNHGNVSHWVRPRFTRLVVEEAWVGLPDGRVVDFERDAIQIRSDDDPDVFSDARQVVFPFSKLEKGATIVLVLREISDAGAWPLPWSRIYFPQGLVPLESFELSVVWSEPERRPHWAADDPELGCTQGPGVLTCSRRRVPALPYDPEVVWADNVSHVTVGAARTWSELAGPVRGHVLEAATDDAGVDALAARLAVDEGPARERLGRIHRFVADRVRYAGFEHGANAVVPHTAAETLERRYGDCKDKVALFLALARRSGLDAYPVLVATTRYAPRKLLAPSWRYFDHMIACVDLAADSTECVDLTDPYSTTGELPVSLQGAVALDLREGGRDPGALPAPDHAWRIEIEASNEVACDGSVVEELDRRFVGGAAAAIRHEIGALTSLERSRWLAEGYAEVMGDAVEPEFELSGLEGSGPVLGLRSVTRFTGAVGPEGLREWTEADAWLVHYARGFRTLNQHHPYRMPGLHVTARNEYRPCPEQRIDQSGAFLDFASEIGSLKRSYTRASDRLLVVETELVVPRQVVDVQRLERFNRFLERVLGETRIWFSVEAAEEGR